MRAMRNGAWVLMVAVMLLAGCRREKTVQAEGAPAENSRMAAVDSTKKGIELIRRDGRGMQSDSERVREKYDWLKKKVEEAMAINKAMLDINLLNTAFTKFQTYTYFDKSDMVLRRNVALFAKSLTKEKNREIIKKYCSGFVSFNMFFHTP